jgi:hypothetical protein
LVKIWKWPPLKESIYSVRKMSIVLVLIPPLPDGADRQMLRPSRRTPSGNGTGGNAPDILLWPGTVAIRQ